jgi:hypothetical protein
MNELLSVPHWDNLPELSWKEKVAYLTVEFLKFPQVDCPVEHIFGNGWYIREMHIPAGSLFLGRAHMHGHEVQLISGSVVWITPGGRKIVEAPLIVHTTPGTHIVVYADTDVIGRTVHPNPTDSRDTEALENDIFESLDTLKELGMQVHQRLLQ